jgi:hypothetical protein
LVALSKLKNINSTCNLILVVAEVVIRVHLVQIYTAKNYRLGICVGAEVVKNLAIISITAVQKMISHSLEAVYSWPLVFAASADQYRGMCVRYGISYTRVVEAGEHHVKFITHQVFRLLNLFVDWTHHVTDLETHTTNLN